MKSLIHVGFGHSGTKSLQLNIFQKHSKIFYVGIPLTHFGGIFSSIKYLEHEEFSFPDINKLVQNEIFGKIEKDQTLVISDETLVEQPLIKYTPAMMPSGIIVKRLSDLFGNADILFTIRNQYDYVSSAYRVLSENYALEGSRPDEFNKWFMGQFSQMRNLFLRNLNFLKTIKIYKYHFPRSDIFILPLELLLYEGFQAYKKTLQKIINKVDLDKIKQEDYIVQNKSVNQKVVIGGEIKKKILEICGKSNYEIQKTTGIPLDKYGYPILN